MRLTHKSIRMPCVNMCRTGLSYKVVLMQPQSKFYTQEKIIEQIQSRVLKVYIT